MISALPTRWSKPLRVFVLSVVLLALVGVFFIVPAQPADACSFGSVLAGGSPVMGLIGCGISAGWNWLQGKASEAALGLVELVLKITLVAVTWLTRAMATFFSFALYRLTQGVGFIGNDMVQTGWRVVRDVANWFFVVFFLVSAISTILNYAKYNARAILPKLIVFAILVNFSLFLGAFVINVSNSLAYIFTSQVAAEHKDIGIYLFNEMGLTSLAGANPDDTGSEAQNQDNPATILANLILAIVFMSVASFVFGALAIMFLFRIVYLWILLILAPLAFIAAIWPATRSYWDKWVKDLVNWSFFAPIASFFIWLATFLVVYINRLIDGGIVANIELGDGAAIALISSADAMFRFITVIIFLLLALKASTTMTGAMGQLAVKGMKTALIGVGVAGGLGLAAKAGGAAAAGIRERVAGSKLGTITANRLANAAQQFRTVPFIGRPLAERGARLRSEHTGRIDEQRKKAKTMTAKENADLANVGGPVTKRYAHAQELIDRGRSDLLDKGTRKMLMGYESKQDIGNTMRDAFMGEAAQEGLLKGQQGTSEMEQRVAIDARVNRMRSNDIANMTGNTVSNKFVQDSLTRRVARGEVNPSQIQHAFQRNENEQGAAAFMAFMESKFIDSKTQQVRPQVTVKVNLSPEGKMLAKSEDVVQNTARQVQHYAAGPVIGAMGAAPEDAGGGARQVPDQQQFNLDTDNA